MQVISQTSKILILLYESNTFFLFPSSSSPLFSPSCSSLSLSSCLFSSASLLPCLPPFHHPVLHWLDGCNAFLTRTSSPTLIFILVLCLASYLSFCSSCGRCEVEVENVNWHLHVCFVLLMQVHITLMFLSTRSSTFAFIVMSASTFCCMSCLLSGSCFGWLTSTPKFASHRCITKKGVIFVLMFYTQKAKTFVMKDGVLHYIAKE